MTDRPPPPPIEDYRDALRHLLIAWRSQVERGIEVKKEHEEVLRLVYPWVAQVHQFGRAYLQLEKHGLTHECHVLARSALEHALLAHWVSVTGDAGVVSRYMEDHRQLVALYNDAKGGPKDAAENTWNLDLLKELVDSREPVVVNEEKVVKSVSDICAALGATNTIYSAYRVHSWFAHPTTHTAGVYLVPLDNGSFALREKPIDPAPGAVLSMLTHCVYWAQRVLDDLTVGKPLGEWLDCIAASIQVTPRLPGLALASE